MLAMEPCSVSTESGDGRTFFALTPSGQLKMPHVGNYCVSFAGEGAAGADISRGANVDATSQCMLFVDFVCLRMAGCARQLLCKTAMLEQSIAK